MSTNILHDDGVYVIKHKYLKLKIIIYANKNKAG